MTAAVVALALVVGCSGAGRSPAARSTDGAATVAAAANAVGAALDERIQGHFDNSAAGAYDNVRAVVVTVGGRPLVERYVNASAEETWNTYSVAKSVMSVLIGIALDEGHIDSVDQTLAELVPSRVPQMADQFTTVSLRQVLTMTGGLPRPAADLSPGAWSDGDDWLAGILAGSTDDAPPGRFAFSDASSHLLSAILTEATGRSALDYAREKLFTPLGIDTEPAAQPVWRASDAAFDRTGFAWPRDPQGHHLGFCCIAMTARDMTRLGQLMLDEGRWNGTRIVSADWVHESTRPQVPTTTRGLARHARGVPRGIAGDYGYQWWVTQADSHRAFFAAGLGGQLIEVVPDLDLVVVVSSVPAAGNADAAALATVVSHVVARALRGSGTAAR